MRRLLPFLAISVLVMPSAGSGAISISPGPDIDFGRINVSQSKTIQLTITNVSPAPITVTNYALSPGQESFAVVPGSPGAPPYILNTAESATVEVVFGPTSPGFKNAALTITTDEPRALGDALPY